MFASLLFLFFVEARFDRRHNFFVEGLVVLQHFLRRIAALRQLCALIVQPGTAFFDDLFFQRKMEQVRAFEISEVSLRSAALIKRACAPTVVSPISPSSSALVTSAATESSTMTSKALERTSVSQIRNASSPELG